MAESAADLNTLRQALGEETISLLGISYGTHLAVTAIRRQPDRIRRAILAGVEGPDHTFTLPPAQQQHLEFLAAEARKQPVAEYVPDLLDAIDSVLTELATGYFDVGSPPGERSPRGAGSYDSADARAARSCTSSVSRPSGSLHQGFAATIATLLPAPSAARTEPRSVLTGEIGADGPPAPWHRTCCGPIGKLSPAGCRASTGDEETRRMLMH